jgi:protein-S-isoprenylcysteine O-methyltransferase Ste14
MNSPTPEAGPEHASSRDGAESEVANLGLARPPFVYLSAVAVGLLLHLLWRVPWLPAPANVPIGIGLVLVAVALFVASVRTLAQAGTPVPGNLPTITIVRTGPFRYSRNPIYLAFTLFQLGIAAWVNSATVLITLVPVLAVMMLVVIPREERYLEKRFPDEYLPYKREVRRWL